MVKIAGAAGGLVNPAVGKAPTASLPLFGIAGDLTKQDVLDLIGPDVSKRATGSGRRAERAPSVSVVYFMIEAKIVDQRIWNKMRQVPCRRVRVSWRMNLDELHSPAGRGDEVVIDQGLVPTAYPYPR